MVETLPSNAEGAGLIPGLGAKIPHALWLENQDIRKLKQCNKFNKDFKNGPHTHTHTHTHTKGLREKEDENRTACSWILHFMLKHGASPVAQQNPRVMQETERCGFDPWVRKIP